MLKNIFLLIAVGTGLSLSAQNMDYRSTVSGHVAANIYQFRGLITQQFPELDSFPVDIDITPTMGLAYDVALANWFSLGAAYSYNGITLRTDKANVELDSFVYEGYLKAYIRRHNIALRPLFHYNLNNDQIDLYSGFRFGVSIWQGGISAETEQLEIADLFGFGSAVKDFLAPLLDWGVSGSTWLPSAQVIPIGVRYYPKPNLGLGLELAGGTPYYAAFTLNGRF